MYFITSDGDIARTFGGNERDVLFHCELLGHLILVMAGFRDQSRSLSLLFPRLHVNTSKRELKLRMPPKKRLHLFFQKNELSFLPARI